MLHRHRHIRLPCSLGVAALTTCLLAGTPGCADGDKGGYVDTVAAAGRGVNSKVPPGSAADVAGFSALPESPNHGSGAFMDSRSILPRGGAAGASGNVGGAFGAGGFGNSAGTGGASIPYGGASSGGAPSASGGTSGGGGSAGASGATGGLAGASAGNAGTSG
ncbi:MAG: hypothetical protein SFV15_27110 [Polyangiaceae bacterium]|nr:hypothetical protein [Polyangiaceae bacterium]